ncbi:MAG TPA: trypsin-like peptidase domain-containing protein [Planctomicrobium sp.]|nr:trypsin-like peptidase domain-containing protein [Planctomicrobium sp.]
MNSVVKKTESQEKIIIRDEDLFPPETLRIEISDQPPDPAVTPPPPLPRSPSSRFWSWIPFLLVLLVLGVLLALAFVRGEEEEQWMEQLAQRADWSVVRILSEEGISGTGFVVASRGRRHLILTNRHVVGAASFVGVALRSDLVSQGEVVGVPKDDEVDLALVEVVMAGLQPLGPLGNFADVRSGMEVVAIGHPFGLDYSITSGVVSGKRVGMVIQTSAPINPGNSGGPLITKKGIVVGVNTETVKPEYGHGLGFSLRADYLLERPLWSCAPQVTDLLNQLKPSRK